MKSSFGQNRLRVSVILLHNHTNTNSTKKKKNRHKSCFLLLPKRNSISLSAIYTFDTSKWSCTNEVRIWRWIALSDIVGLLRRKFVFFSCERWKFLASHHVRVRDETFSQQFLLQFLKVSTRFSFSYSLNCKSKA